MDDESEDIRNEMWLKWAERHGARSRRRFSYKIRRIRQNDPSLTFLSLGVSDEESIPPLLNALEKSKYLVQLDVCCLTLTVGRGLGMMLMQNSSLRHLALHYCNIPSVEAVRIFQSLTVNSTLRILDLSYCSRFFLDDTVSSALSQSLPNMKGLALLKLRCTDLSPLAVEGIFHSLQKNEVLESIDLSENLGVESYIGSSLIKSLPRTMNLQIINVEMTGLSSFFDQRPDLMQTFADGMRVNQKIWKIDGLVLHCVEHYSNKKERESQRQCLKSLDEIEFYKKKNSLMSGRWLTLDQQALWPFVLTRVADNGRFCHDSTFYLIREKCDLLFSSCPVKQSKSKTRPRKKEVGRRRPRQKMKRVPRVKAKPSVPSFSGFHCRIHGGMRLLPIGCCVFENIKPFHSRSCS